MSTEKPTLVYWDIRALAEPIRLLLNYLKVDFNDTRIPFGPIGPNLSEAWTTQKQTHGLDFPNLPFYKDEDVSLTQSLAILQHIGRKYNLAGDSLKEKATLDMVAQTINDIRWQAWVVYNDPNFHNIKADWKTTIPERLSELNKFLQGKDFVLGDKISYVDFLMYESVEWFRQFAPELFTPDSENLGNITKFQTRIENIPTITQYLNSDKFKSWPFFAPVVHFGWSKDPDFKPMRYAYRNGVAKYPLEK